MATRRQIAEADRTAPTARQVSAKRRGAYDFGIRSELEVAQFLRAGGYTIFDRRVRIGAAELDVIAVRDDTVAFVEVKARKAGWDGLEAVTARKRCRIVNAVNVWIADNPEFASHTIRFDIAVVRKEAPLEYLENAFEAEEAGGYVW